MNKVYTSACVLIPPKEKWEPIQAIRKKYDRQIKRWMPHINLFYPFPPKSEYEELIKKFSEICRNVDPFEVALKNFRYFHHGHEKYTIWLKPEPIESIVHLQSLLLKIVPNCNDLNKFEDGFNPHLSVGQIQGKNNILETMNALQNNWKPLTFHVELIYFISREEKKSSIFQIERDVLLNK
jgi:2'-5' RNA ligase